ncbi:MAG: calcium-translocating P-type ATPase, PMCA-type [Defluviitaleaceae bacterium]|nr:calcium-translocating P-type ATPase, PMCA-type [Defluviitaleaceae bacterium]
MTESKLHIGLTQADVDFSAHMYGTNTISQKAKVGFLRRYIASFGDPIIRILLVALGVNLLLLFRDANWYESVGIAVAVLLATLISTLSEYGSESAFEKLQEEAANVKCRARRDGKLILIPITDIVVGDVIYVQAGERIPADGVLVSGEISVDQAALNGETREAYKYPGEVTCGNTPLDFLSKSGLFRGSVVCSGEGIMAVTHVGDATFYGRLALDVQESTIESPLKARLTQLAKTISRFGYAAAVIVVIANLFNGIVAANHFDIYLISAHLANRGQLMRDIMQALTLGITVIVMAVPEGLPMMITVVLSANMRRMLKDNVLVRKLVGIETSGSLNILFTDKTGTLTKGMLEVTSFITPQGRVLDSEEFKGELPLYKKVAINCFYNNSAQISSKKLRAVAIGGNSTDRALLEYIMEDAARLPSYEKMHSRPFNSRDKMSLAVVSTHNRDHSVVLVKGAPEMLLPQCRYAYNERAKREIFHHPAEVKKALSGQAREGVRLLALCENNSPDIEKGNLTLVGFLGIRDEIRNEARKAIDEVQNAGVQAVMVTGDNRETAVSVATSLNLLKSGEDYRVLTSQALNKLSDIEVKKRLPEIRVIARALPSDKGRLVRLAQESGLVAGMTGDGINDAPALKKADVGFAMGDGTEIAKEASDIVILDNNFASIVKSILYGRTIFKSIRKFLIFQLTINLCAVGISVLGPFIGVASPVTVIQMLWINMIMDTLAGLAYAGEAPLPEYMKEAPKKRTEPIINRYMFNQIATTGLYTTFLSLLFFKVPFFAAVFRNDERYLLTAFFALFIFAGVFNSLNARTNRINLLAHLQKNRLFIGVMLAVVVMQVLLIYYGGAVFRTTGLRFGELALVVGLASTVIIVDLGRKLVLRAYNRKGFI